MRMLPLHNPVFRQGLQIKKYRELSVACQKKKGQESYQGIETFSPFLYELHRYTDTYFLFLPVMG